jgi:hypothetical protein
MGPVIIAIIGAIAAIWVAYINNRSKHQELDNELYEPGEWIIVEEEPEDDFELVFQEEYLIEDPEGDLVYVVQEEVYPLY